MSAKLTMDEYAKVVDQRNRARDIAAQLEAELAEVHKCLRMENRPLAMRVHYALKAIEGEDYIGTVVDVAARLRAAVH